MAVIRRLSAMVASLHCTVHVRMDTLISHLRTQLFAKENAKENAKKLVSSSFITKLASRMYPFSNSLEQILNPDSTVFNEKCKDQVQRLANRMYPFNDALRGAFDLDPSVLSARLKQDHLDSLDKQSRQQLRCKHILEAWSKSLQLHMDS